MLRGQAVNNPVSQFVREVPEEFLEGNLPRYRSFGGDYTDSGRYHDDDGYGRIGRSGGSSGFGGGFGGAGSYGTSGGFAGKPKAPTPRRDVKPEDKPYAAIKSLGALQKGSTFSAGKADYDVGDRVKHIKFGEGVVKNMENRDGSNYVTVEFDTAGVRVLSAAFAKLQKL